jgi:pilus assembly protein CpaB
MRAVFGLVLVVGVGLAGTAVYMVQGHLQGQAAQLAAVRAAAAQQVPTVEVFAVNRAIAYGEALTRADLKVIRYAEPYLPAGVFRSVEEMFPQGEGVVRRVLRPMEANEPVLAVKVTEPGEDAGITNRLSPGMSAFAISVDATSGVSGFLRPGDRVDVYWTGDAGNGDRIGVTRLIESGLKLVAVDQKTDDNMTTAVVARTVTVEVSPQQVARLAQAQASGSLSLALVGQAGLEDAVVAPVMGSEISGREAAAAEAPVEVAQSCQITERKGSEVIVTLIPCN